MEKCSLCGHENPDGAAVCAECGAPLAMAATVCPSCGKPVKPGLKFCTACGTKIDATKNEKPAVKPAAPEKPAAEAAEQPAPKQEKKAKELPPQVPVIGVAQDSAPAPAAAPAPVPEHKPQPTPVAGNVCPKCGKPVKPGMKFCTNCGAKMDEKPAQPAPAAAPAPVQPTCPQCGRPIKPGLKFCTACGAPIQSGKAGKPAGNGKFGKKELFAVIAGGLAFLTTLFALIFVLTPFVSVKVSGFGMSEKEAASGISMFASIIKGNETLSLFEVSAWIGYAASVCYWIFAFVFAAYFTYAIATAGGAGTKQFKTGIKFLAVMTGLALVMMILGQIAMGQATEDADSVAAFGVKISKYVGPTGLFVTMLLMLGGYIALFVLSKKTETRPAYPKCAKAKKPLKIVLPIVLSVLLAISCIVGVVGLVGGSGKSLVKKFVNGVNDNDVTAVAECMCPKGHPQYAAMVAQLTAMSKMSSLSEEIFGGKLTDWSYEKIEKNDYIERGTLSARVKGDSFSGTFYLQKSSYDNKWYVTFEYDAEFYDGNEGTGYYNAVEMRSSSGYVSGSGSSGSVYALYECDESGKYTVTANVSFRAETFEQSSVGGTSSSNSDLGVYSREFSMTKGKAYYFVFSGSSAEYSMEKTGDIEDPNQPVGPITTDGTLTANAAATSVTLATAEKLYTLEPSDSGFYAVGVRNAGATLKLYDSKKKEIASAIADDKSRIYHLESGKTYYVGITAQDSSYSGDSVYAYVRAEEYQTSISTGTQVTSLEGSDDATPWTYSFYSYSGAYSLNAALSNESTSSIASTDTTIDFIVVDDKGNRITPSAAGLYEFTSSQSNTVVVNVRSGEYTYVKLALENRTISVSDSYRSLNLPATERLYAFKTGTAGGLHIFAETYNYDNRAVVTLYNDSLVKLADSTTDGYIAENLTGSKTYYVGIRAADDGDVGEYAYLSVDDCDTQNFGSNYTKTINGGILVGEYSFSVDTSGKYSVTVSGLDSNNSPVTSSISYKYTVLNNGVLYTAGADGTYQFNRGSTYVVRVTAKASRNSTRKIRIRITPPTLTENSTTTVALSSSGSTYALIPSATTYYVIADENSNATISVKDSTDTSVSMLGSTGLYSLSGNATYSVTISGDSYKTARITVQAIEAKGSLSAGSSQSYTMGASDTEKIWWYQLTPNTTGSYLFTHSVTNDSGSTQSDVTVHTIVFTATGDPVSTTDSDTEYALTGQIKYIVFVAAEKTTAYTRRISTQYTRSVKPVNPITVSVGGTYTGTLSNSTREVWFKFTPTSTATYNIYSVGATSSFDLHGYLYTANNFNSSVTDDDDGGGTRDFKITRQLTANTTYYVKVIIHSNGSGNGSFTLHVTRS